MFNKRLIGGKINKKKVCEGRVVINEKFFCPICGCILKEEYSIGDICPCCGNEKGFDDDIDKPNIDREEELAMLEKLWYADQNEEPVPEYVKEYLKNISFTQEEAWEILRKEWIKDGYKWKCNYKNERPENWNMKLAKKQLLNITIK